MNDLEKSEMEQWLQLRKSSLHKNDETKVASVACFNAAGKMLFGRRSDSGKWTLPGGHFELGESPEQAALRELKEETGLTPNEDGFGYLGEGLAHDTLRIYAFKCFVDGEPTAEADPDKEMAEFRWVSITNGLPEEINKNLHAPKNVTLKLLGLQGGKLLKGDQPATEIAEVDMQKNLREKFTALAGAAAMMAAPIAAHAPQDAKALEPPKAVASISPPTMSVAPKPAPEPMSLVAPKPIESTPWHANGLTEELKPIAHLESSYGKNMVHAPNSKGDFHTAWGACGLKPVTASEEYQRRPAIRAMFPGLDNQKDFIQAMKTNHTFYNLIASAHWGYLKRATGSPEKAAYAWRWGIGAAAAADANAIKSDPYVQGYTKLFAKIAGSPATKSIMRRGFDQYTKEWLSKAGPTVSYDHYSRQPDLAVLDPKKQGTGATGAEKQRPQRPPRVYLYEGDTPPEPQVAAGGFKYRAELPASMKLYDFSKDEHKLLKPRITKTPRGTMVDPPDLDAIERKLIKLGYHGYRAYSPNAPNAVAIFGKVPVKPVAA